MFTYETNGDNIDIQGLVSKYGNRIKFSAGIKPMVTFEIGSADEKVILKEITEFLK